mgnify:CR=1 FL=1
MKKLLTGLIAGIAVTASLTGCGTLEPRTTALETFGQPEATPAESRSIKWPNFTGVTDGEGEVHPTLTQEGRKELEAARAVCEYNEGAVKANAQLYQMAMSERNSLVRLLQAQQEEALLLHQEEQLTKQENFLLRGLNIILAVALAL